MTLKVNTKVAKMGGIHPTICQNETLCMHDIVLALHYAANSEGELRKGRAPGLAFPTSFYFPANYSVAMFVAMDGHNEDKELLQYIPCQGKHFLKGLYYQVHLPAILL